MQDIKKVIALLFCAVAGFYHANAKEFQPRFIITEPGILVDDNYNNSDTVPKRMFVKAQALQQPAQIRTVTQTQPVRPINTRPELVTKPVQSKPVVVRPPKQKDTALIRILYEGFKVEAKTSTADKIKIRHIIDSVVSKKESPSTSTGSPELSYQDLVHIIDSLLKANKIDSSKVLVDTLGVKKTAQAVVVPEVNYSSGSFIQVYWWLVVLALLLLAYLTFFIIRRKKGVSTDPKIFFSYAWDQDEALIMQLYNSLKKEGFNVVKDKENIGYKGVISKFMEEIGSADFVIVAISDKYLKSKFCMYELYEIFRNSGMNKDVFGRKIFPIRIDEAINLSDPDVVNGYTRYWKQQEQEWAQRMKDDSDSITEEQARQFQFIKRLVNDVNNILSCVADINSLNLSTLKSNDFADIKAALQKSI
jgi:TIR domain